MALRQRIWAYLLGLGAALDGYGLAGPTVRGSWPRAEPVPPALPYCGRPHQGSACERNHKEIISVHN
jgi:hypothetical protein